jgi:alpha-galactosidase
MTTTQENGDRAPVLDLSSGGHSVALPVSASVLYGADGLTLRRLRPAPDGEGRLSDTRPPLSAVLRMTSDASGGTLALEVTNVSEAPLRLWSLRPLDVRGPFLRVGHNPAPTDAWSVFRNGYQSWSGTGTLRMDEADLDPPLRLLRESSTNPVHRAAGDAGCVRSELLTALETGLGFSIGFGFVTSGRQLSGIEIDARGGMQRGLMAGCDLDGMTVDPGETVLSETLRVLTTSDPQAALCGLADELGRNMRARVPPRPPSGWCSWYYYFTKVTQADVEENLTRCAALRERTPLDYVMVDDGHQAHIGDWLSTNAKFPDGMASLASRIRKEGFDAGIWLAPFLADPKSDVALAHPEWLLRAKGKPVVALWNPGWSKTRPMWTLDTTQSAVLDHLEGIARTMRSEWGYRILKLDFLYAVTLTADRHMPTSTRADALRMGLEAIRRGAGDDAFLLGCGCPLGPAVGLVDGMRIGQDVTPWWSQPWSRTIMRDRHGLATKHALRNTLARAFMHRRLWANDPDCLLVRERRNKLNLGEVRSLASVIGLTDGMFVLSDRLAELSDARAAIAETAAGLTGAFGSVPDLFAQDMPETIVAHPAGRATVMVANFGNRARSREVDLADICPDLSHERELTDIWTGNTHRVTNGKVTLPELAAHACVVLAAHPAIETARP